MKKPPQFVLSSKVFKNVEHAEEAAIGLLRAGVLKQTTTLFEIKSIYDMKIRFEKRGKKK